ncbi:hypothetical protein [Dyadobacter aurulentus]|uniref:hypothetical protein n=1 Tax=Dyadobacter sp. UC 10 TaxID=2605428 RepID=UPI0011F2ABF5|nr:hypothetical protein [Dyadobacter sp. UC 10]KAA0993651.1 hypothetical protein FXO21_27485 [Dyadobacter sp. UC 10]
MTPTTDRQLLLKMHGFLEETAATNEDTTFDPDQEYLVEALIRLVKARGKTSIAEDFDTPYLHPMLTVQKWVEELKLIVADTLAEERIDSQ